MEAFGRVAVCTGCHQTFKIGESRPPFEWKPTSLAEDSWIGVAPPEEKREVRHCIMCDAPMEPDAVRCPACGANQVTGIVHRSKPEPVTEQRRILAVLPLRLIVVLCVFAAIAIGGYYAILAIGRSAGDVTDQMVDTGIARRAATFLKDGGDEYAFADQFAGRVTDQNLPRFVRMLSSGDATIRQAAALLIGSGQIARLGPILEAGAESGSEDALRALHAIGMRRLARMSSEGDEAARTEAARAMLLLCGVERSSSNLQSLSAAVPVPEKIQRINALGRPWPEAVGGFGVVIGETPAPFTVTVEQIGRMFYLKIGAFEFHTAWGGQKELPPLPRFSIPASRWSAATGGTMNIASLEELFGGFISLGSDTGFGWAGKVRVQGRQDVPGRLPGFLPLDTPGRGETVTADIVLRRG